MAGAPDAVQNSISCLTNTCFLGQTIEININDGNLDTSLAFYDNNECIYIQKPSSSFTYNYTPSYVGTHTIYIRANSAGVSSNTITITVIEPTLNASLENLGELIATNLNTMGVSDAQASDGLTTLANKILNISRKDNYNLDLTSSASFVQWPSSVYFIATLTNNGMPVSDESLSYEVKTGSTVLNSGTSTTDTNGQITLSYQGSARSRYVDVTVSYGDLQKTVTIYDKQSGPE